MQVFANIVKVKDHQIRVGPKSSDECPYKETGKEEPRQGKWTCAERAGDQSDATTSPGHLEPRGTRRGRKGRRVPLRLWGRSARKTPWFGTSNHQMVRVKFCCLKPPRLGWLVAAAPFSKSPRQSCGLECGPTLIKPVASSPNFPLGDKDLSKGNGDGPSKRIIIV